MVERVLPAWNMISVASECRLKVLPVSIDKIFRLRRRWLHDELEGSVTRPSPEEGSLADDEHREHGDAHIARSACPRKNGSY
jgi:hypothetical protein